MTAIPDHELEDLLNRLADGLLPEDDEQRLAAFLKESPRARKIYRDWMALHSSLIWDYAAAATAPPAPSAKQSRIPLYAAAALLLLLATLAIFLARGQSAAIPIIAEVSSVQGAVSWSSGNGETKPLSAGSPVAGGTISVEGESSSAQLRFKDGTLVTLSGPTRLDVSETDRKRMILQDGVISASVAKQPPGKPLMIRTAMAELEVLGTEFVVSSAAGETSLEVKTGKVSLKRFVDGQSVVVASGQTAAASLATSVMSPSSPASPPHLWSISFPSAPRAPLIGKWVAPADGLPGRVASQPFIAGRREDNRPVVHHAVGLPRLYGRRSYVALDGNSVLQFRYRQREDTGIKCFISCKRTGGGFGGNYEITLPRSAAAPDSQGWRTVETPLSAMVPVIPDENLPIAELEITLLLIHSYESDSGLEISGISVSDQPGNP